MAGGSMANARRIGNRNRLQGANMVRLNAATSNVSNQTRPAQALEWLLSRHAQAAFIPYHDKSGRASGSRVVAIPLSGDNVVDFPHPEDNSKILTAVPTVIQMMNREGEGAPNKVQLIAYYLSILAMTFSGFRQEAVNFLRGRNYTIRNLSIPTQAEDEFFLIKPEISVGDLAIYIGQLCLMLYKNFSEVNYTKFMQARIKEMAARAGLTAEGEIDVILSCKAAQIIKSTVGQDRELRVSILNKMKAKSTQATYFGPVTAYVLEIIQWTDMNHVNIINQHLVVPKSPVLSDPMLGAEVINFARAMKLIRSHPEPKYFRIVADSVDTNALNRNNFRVLLAVALRIGVKSSPTLAQFVGSTQVNENEIARLVKIHESSTNDYTRPHITRGNLLKVSSYVVSNIMDHIATNGDFEYE